MYDSYGYGHRFWLHAKPIKPKLPPRRLEAPVYGQTDYDALYRARNKHPGTRYEFLRNCHEYDAQPFRDDRRKFYVVDLAFDIYGKVLDGYVAVFQLK